ncbi:NlpC/P60 family protein [Marispirochaeta sp.]|jgi:hypothetical protein|uniref:NlpC/P60 family protein n=1 Tax=Marispirochaeta sp. TaxID=2038653 RepID=UPI0029C7C13D|nr:NlpC/P60 family protein [Marispirochaeta sp.]
MKGVHKAAVFIFLAILIGGFQVYGLDVHEEIIYPAQRLKGAPYSFGNEGPRAFDCSGLVYYLYKPHLPSIPRTSRDYSRYGSQVGINELLPGDLLLFATTNNRGIVSHVAIYIGQKSVIHAVSNGPETGVIVSRVDSGYWRRTFHSARRVFDTATQSTQKEQTSIEFERGLYTGPLKDGEPSGTGTMRLKNGDTYQGEFRDGLFHGQGTYTWSSGKSYTGRFEKGEIVETEKTAGKPETYMEEKDSPWDSWDGEVYGDFREWREQEQSAFEAFKARDREGTAGKMSR